MFTPDNLPNLLSEVEKFKAELARQNIPSLWQHLDDSQKAVQQVADSLTNPQQKQALMDLLGESAKARKDLETMMPGLLADLQKQQDANLNSIRELAAGIEKAERDFESKLKEEADLAAQVAPADMPETPLDPNLGVGLAMEFLQAMGLLDAAPAKKPFDDTGSVARMWEDHAHDESVAQAQPPAAKETPPEPAKPKSPLRRPDQPKKPTAPEPSHDESIGNWPHDD